MKTEQQELREQVRQEIIKKNFDIIQSIDDEVKLRELRNELTDLLEKYKKL